MKSNLFLVTATLVLIVLLCLYEPQSTEVEPITEPITEVVNNVVIEKPQECWYRQQDFEQTPFDFVRASFNHQVPLIEIVQARASKDIDADVSKLKAVIEERIGTQVQIFLLDTNNQELVTKIYE